MASDLPGNLGNIPTVFKRADRDKGKRSLEFVERIMNDSETE